MASLRNLAIVILRLTGHASIAAALRYHARQPGRPLQTIINADDGRRSWAGAAVGMRHDMGPSSLVIARHQEYGVEIGEVRGGEVMKAAMVVKFTTSVPGREKAAIAYAREVDDFYGKKAAEGLCTEPKWFWATAGESMWIVEGEYEALLGILATPEVQKFLVTGPILVEGFGWALYQVGREEMFGPYEETLKELKII